MSGGFVLDFSDRTFEELFDDTLGINIWDSEYEYMSGSKANRMRCFWKKGDDQSVSKILRVLLSIVESNDNYSEREFKKANEIMKRLENSKPEKKEHSEDDLKDIWEPGKIRLFISHRDSHKKEVALLADRLREYGITSFVAHEEIQPTTAWKNEIIKGLDSMDACLAYMTDDFYESVWTNQELGYAESLGVPVFLYSVNRVSPEGFKFDIQTIRGGEEALINTIKRKFSRHKALKKGLLDSFHSAIDGSFLGAKKALVDILGLDLEDSEIVDIVSSINGPAKYINQLSVLLCGDEIPDNIKKKHKIIESRYCDLLQNKILSQHSGGRFSLKLVDGKSYFEILDKDSEAL